MPDIPGWLLLLVARFFKLLTSNNRKTLHERLRVRVSLEIEHERGDPPSRD